MNKFWKWVRNKAPDGAEQESEERTLFLNGAIASESWFDDDVTPALFKSDLESGKGDITVWINSPGGDCFAAAQIYNMLRDYKGRVTVKIDSLAASAASVIAMAGDNVLISPTGMFMIHNPSTVAMGDHSDLSKAIDMLNEVKESIINAYQTKTGLSRNKLSKLMEDETWMDANKAVEMHFADGIIERNRAEPVEEKDGEPEKEKGEETETEKTEEGQEPDEEKEPEREKTSGMLFSTHPFELAVTNQILSYVRTHAVHDSINPVTDEKLSVEEKETQEGEPVTGDTPVQEETPAEEALNAGDAAPAETRIEVAKCYQRLKSMKDAF